MGYDAVPAKARLASEFGNLQEHEMTVCIVDSFFCVPKLSPRMARCRWQFPQLMRATHQFIIRNIHTAIIVMDAMSRQAPDPK